MTDSDTGLKRTLTLPVLIFYGLGTIIGAGIYVLVGKVAGVAGDLLPYAFALAGGIAAFTAFSYAELAARFPQSAGAALYADKAYGRQALSRLVGWLVIFTGVVSAATIINGFPGYLAIFVTLPPLWVKVGLALILAGIAAWGIRESAALIVTITLLELGGLVYVLVVGVMSVQNPAVDSVVEAAPSGGGLGMLMGAFLAFYAFIGFEDMVNVVEEVKRPRRNVPLAILASVATATVLYVLVSFVALAAMPAGVLAASSAPLADLVAGAGVSPRLIALISLVAVINGALVQIIMASRVIYGMASQGLAPELLGKVYPATRTPVRATLLVALCVLVFALWLPLATLAGLTSMTMLTIFAIVNLGLVLIKRRDGPSDTFQVPQAVPACGALLCVGLVLVQLLG